MMTAEQVMELLEKARDQSLKQIPENAALMDYYLEKSFNHGIMAFFYQAAMMVTGEEQEEGGRYDKVAV